MIKKVFISIYLLNDYKLNLMFKKISLFIFLVLICAISFAQIKVVFSFKVEVDKLDSSLNYFVAGNFNNWTPNDTAFQFKRKADGSYILEKNLPVGNYEYKLTKGDWKSVETGINGETVSNRKLALKIDTAIDIKVLNWAGHFKKSKPLNTATSNVKVIDTDFNIPQLGKKRKIWVYLPPTYEGTNAKYPVIYMHDGQNLFDEATSGFGEWKIDEILNDFAQKVGEGFIVVGIDHGNEDRLKEYNPYDSEYGKGEGKQYVDFLAKTLKPYIDKTYRTKKDFKNTSIAGSSMGGLISMYAIIRYPNVFGNAGIFSPAFWIGKPILDDLKIAQHQIRNRKIYFVAGEQESKTMVSDMKEVYQIINPSGKYKNIKFVTKTDGAHKEWFWSSEFVDFYKFIAR